MRQPSACTAQARSSLRRWATNQTTPCGGQLESSGQVGGNHNTPLLLLLLLLCSSPTIITTTAAAAVAGHTPHYHNCLGPASSSHQAATAGKVNRTLPSATRLHCCTYSPLPIAARLTFPCLQLACAPAAASTIDSGKGDSGEGGEKLNRESAIDVVVAAVLLNVSTPHPCPHQCSKRFYCQSSSLTTV